MVYPCSTIQISKIQQKKSKRIQNLKKKKSKIFKKSKKNLKIENFQKIQKFHTFYLFLARVVWVVILYLFYILHVLGRILSGKKVFYKFFENNTHFKVHAITILEVKIIYYQNKHLSMIFMFFYLFYLSCALERILSKQKKNNNQFKQTLI